MKKFISKLLLTIIAANLILNNPVSSTPVSSADYECTLLEVVEFEEITGL